MSYVARRRQECDALLSDRRLALKGARREITELRKARKQTRLAVEAQKIIQVVAEAVQRRAHEQITKVVTKCMDTVFEDNPYDFRIDFERKRGKTEAHLLFVERKSGVVCDPLESSGYGYVDVAALALRLACILLSTPRRRKLLVNDEPFRNVHGTNNRARAAELILTLAKDLGFQFVLATGLEWLKIGKVIQL